MGPRNVVTGGASTRAQPVDPLAPQFRPGRGGGTVSTHSRLEVAGSVAPSGAKSILSFSRVPRLAALPPRRSTRDYIPTPPSGAFRKQFCFRGVTQYSGATDYRKSTISKSVSELPSLTLRVNVPPICVSLFRRVYRRGRRPGREIDGEQLARLGVQALRVGNFAAATADPGRLDGIRINPAVGQRDSA